MDVIKEIVLELLRALLLEDLCLRVKAQFVGRSRARRLDRHRTVFLRIHLRHRKRLLNKLTTESGKKL